MHDIQLMEIRYSTDHLFEIPTGLILIDFGLFHDIIKQLSFLNIFHNKEEMPGCLDYLCDIKKYFI